MKEEAVDVAGYQAVKKGEAQAMADFIENWLGHPIMRKMLKICATRDACGRRVEKALKKYADGSSSKDFKACIKCKVAMHIINLIIGAVLRKTKSNGEEAVAYLRDPVWRKGLASVLEGIAEWGPAKPFTAYAPFLVVWNFTRACNLRCRHCYALAGVRDPNELTTVEALKAVDALADAGVAYIALSGGEPLVRSDFFKVVERIISHEMAFSIATNGTLLSDGVVKSLKKYGCKYVQVSLDGAKAKTHNWLRGGNTFELTIKGIRRAVKAGLHVGVATTVTQRNYDEVPAIINLAEGLGAKTFMYYNFIPTGRGVDITSLDLTPWQRERLLKMMARETKRRQIALLSTACQYSRVCMQNASTALSMTHFDNARINGNSALAVLAEFVGGCGAGRLYCALDYDGSITPCVFIPIKLGNIRSDNFLKVWHMSEVFWRIRRREDFLGACGGCAYRNVCGGCRARAYGYFNDLQAPDVGCVHNESYWKRLKSLA